MSSPYIFTAASFVGANAEYPSQGKRIPPVNQGDTAWLNTPINLIKSDGVTEMVFDKLETALKCLAFMDARYQYYLMANDDIMIVNVSGVKLLILETTFRNTKLMNSFNICYLRGYLACVHRNLATIGVLTAALVSVGYKKSSDTQFDDKFDLDTAFLVSPTEKPRIQVVDINYVAPTTDNIGSFLADEIPIVIPRVGTTNYRTVAQFMLTLPAAP